MPLLDGDDRVVGYALMESRETGNYMRCYLVCDFSTHKLRMYPEEAEFDPDLSKYAPFAEINSQYITKVSVPVLRYTSLMRHHLWYHAVTYSLASSLIPLSQLFSVACFSVLTK